MGGMKVGELEGTVWEGETGEKVSDVRVLRGTVQPVHIGPRLSIGQKS